LDCGEARFTALGEGIGHGITPIRTRNRMNTEMPVKAAMARRTPKRASPLTAEPDESDISGEVAFAGSVDDGQVHKMSVPVGVPMTTTSRLTFSVSNAVMASSGMRAAPGKPGRPTIAPHAGKSTRRFGQCCGNPV